MKAFERYIKYREITDNARKLNLLAVLLSGPAGDWYDALPEDNKDAFIHLCSAFNARYQATETLKFKSAAEIFTRKQLDTETVDEYVTHMRKLAKLCSADDTFLKFAITSGFKPYISVQVMQAKPDTIDKLLDIARMAELTMPKATLAAADSALSLQLADMQLEMRRLSSKVDNAMTAAVRSLSPTPDRRVHLARPESPGPSTSPAQEVSSTFYRPPSQMNARNDRGRPSYQQQQQQPTSVRYQEQQQQFRQDNGPCSRCARHHSKNAFCPARDGTKLCFYCNRPGHFRAACFSAPKQL